ncbi:MAG: right-handed parallel beta-helix repeat-containing protein [Arenibacter sp.]
MMKATTVLASLILTITLLCCNTEEVIANTAEQALGIIEIYSGTSNTLQEAIINLNNSGTIIIKGKIIIDESIIIPMDITLDVHEGGMFELKGVSTFEISGKIIAGLYPIFNSKVQFLDGSVTTIKSEWFGFEDLSVNYALLSAGTIPVELTNDITVNSAILINSDQTLLIKNATIFPTSPMIGGAVIKNRNAKDSNITVVGGLIDGAGVSDIAFDAILFTGVDNALIQDVVARDVHTTASKDSGNFHLVNCTNSKILNVEAHDTWKMGIKVDGGSFNTISGGYFTGTHDSGIGAINSPNIHVIGVYVDNCGTSDASNIAINLQNGIFENSISINARGKNNGNGLTVGHEGYPAFNSVIRNNLFINNATKGVWLQGSTNSDISILNNIIVNNGNGSKHPNSAGVTVYFGALRTLIQGNEILGNMRGVNLSNTSGTTTILDNRIINNDLNGIENDGLNTSIKSNHLSNTTNIFNDDNYTNLTETNNNKQGLIPIDYSRLKTLPWLTDKQKTVIYKLVN